MDPLPCAPKDLQMPGSEFNPNAGSLANPVSSVATGPIHSATSVVSFQLDQLDGLGQPDAKRLKKM